MHNILIKDCMKDWDSMVEELKSHQKFTNIFENTFYSKFLEDFTYERSHILIIEILENIEKYIQYNKKSSIMQ